MSRISWENFSKTLYEAVETNNDDLVSELLDQGFCINTHYDNGNTLLHVNAHAGSGKITRYLLENGCDVDATDNDRQTALHVAFVKDNLSVAEELLKYYPEVNVKDYWNDTALHCFAAHIKASDATDQEELSRMFRMARTMLSLNANPNEPDDRRHTPFHSVLMNGNPELVRLFLERGADVRRKNCYGSTALHYCALNSDSEVMKIILDTKLVSTEEKTIDKGETALHWAAQYSKYNCIQVLLDYGANVNCVDFIDRTPIFYVAQPYYPLYTADFKCQKRQRSMELLIKRGANLNHVTALKDTILKVLVKQDCPCVAKQVVTYLTYRTVKNVRINERNMKVIKKNEDLLAHYNACLGEIGEMKKRKLYGTVSFYAILTADLRAIAAFARNADLARVLKKSGIVEQSFPIFAQLIVERFNKGARYQRILNEAANNLHGILQFADPTCIFYEKVLMFMSNCDLINLRNCSRSA